MIIKTTIAILMLGYSTLAFTNETALRQPNKVVPPSSDSSNGQIVYHKGDPPAKDKYTRGQVRSGLQKAIEQAKEVNLSSNDIEPLVDMICGMNEQGEELMNPAYHYFFINRENGILKIYKGEDLKDTSRYTIEVSWDFTDQTDEYHIPRTNFKCSKEYGKTWTSNWVIETDPPL